MNKVVLAVVLALCVAGAVVEAAKHKAHKKGLWSRSAVNTAIIDQINDDDSISWVAGVNTKFVGRTLADVKPLLGTKRGGPKLPVKAKSTENLEVPTDYDVRDDWAELCPSTAEVRDQSDCGSCWAFGASEAMTDRVCIATNGTKTPHLSSADLLACCDECGDGCDGGYPSSAWEYWVETGLVTGGNYSTTIKDNGCYPYPFPPCEHHVNGTHYPACPSDEYDTPSCPNKCANSATWKSDKVKGKSAYSLSDLDEIQQDLMQYGSLEVDFDVYEDFLTYKSGVYSHVTGDYLGGHAVKLLGWGVENGKPYWTIMNSWNGDWGDNGQFKILRGSDECGIEDDVNGGLFQ